MTESYFKIIIVSLCFIITCTIKNLTSKQSVAHEDIVEIQSANIYNHLVKKCTYIQRNSQVYINIVIFYCRYTHLERNLTCTCRLSARLLHWNSYQESSVRLPRPFPSFQYASLQKAQPASPEQSRTICLFSTKNIATSSNKPSSGPLVEVIRFFIRPWYCTLLTRSSWSFSEGSRFI